MIDILYNSFPYHWITSGNMKALFQPFYDCFCIGNWRIIHTFATLLRCFISKKGQVKNLIVLGVIFCKIIIAFKLLLLVTRINFIFNNDNIIIIFYKNVNSPFGSRVFGFYIGFLYIEGFKCKIFV